MNNLKKKAMMINVIKVDKKQDKNVAEKVTSD